VGEGTVETSTILGRRRAGVLCHITSLPGGAATGTLGVDALRFLDFIADAGLSIWQMLPLNPPDRFGSPYHSGSLFALHEALVDPALGLRSARELRRHALRNSDAYDQFLRASAHWLEDYCRFTVLRRRFGADWSQWPEPLRRRDERALLDLDTSAKAALGQVRYRQFAIHAGVFRLRMEAHARGVLLFGDLPLYPAFDSADVWAHQEIFLLDEHQRPSVVAGVPPDYFSATGQLWGNPIYAWDVLARNGYAWWVERIRSQFALFDIVRIDHFRGLQAYWAVPPDADDARAGSWQEGPGASLLDVLRDRISPLTLVAEDLGVITPDVDVLRETFGLPGMRVLQFAFSGDVHNPHLPANYRPNTVAYTGTHDNDTTLGWYQSLDPNVRDVVDRLAEGQVPWSMIEVLCRSAANTAIVPLQDLLRLDGRHRMNTPGSVAGNWRWRFDWAQFPAELALQIRTLLSSTGRV
jgi:4-alpha-glucanotransferase